MDSPAHLRTLLRRTLESGDSSTEPELFEELTLNRDTLLRLFDVGGKSPAERREVESGRITVNGKSLSANTEFARQVSFLSDQLDVSERHIASLLHTTQLEQPNVTPVELAEATVAAFHIRRRELADCVLHLLQISLETEYDDCPDIYFRVYAYTLQHIFSKRSNGSDPSLATRILKELENNDRELSKALATKQNAVSQTTVPSAQSVNGSLGADVMEARCNALKLERHKLAEMLYLIARIGHLHTSELRKAIEWLASNTLQSVAVYLLATVLAAFDPVAPTPGSKDARIVMVSDSSLLNFMKSKLNPSVPWKEDGLKALVLLKWTLFLTEARHRDTSLEARDGFQADQLETQIWNSVQGDAFRYMANLVNRLQGESDPFIPLGVDGMIEPEPHYEVPESSFKQNILDSLDIVIRMLIHHASSELRKIKQRQEDIVLAGARMDRTRAFRASVAPSGQAIDADRETARNDIATLFSFIGALYSSLPPERALQFWGASSNIKSADPHRSPLAYLVHSEQATPRLPSFLQWSVWSTQAQDVDMTTALYLMLSGLAKGQQCSELAYNFVASGGTLGSGHSGNGDSMLSWSAIFDLLESWAIASANPKPVPVLPPGAPFSLSSRQWHTQPPAQAQPLLGPREVLFAQSFLRFTSTVVTHSVEVRRTLAGHTQFRPIPTLVSLVPLGIPLELKGAIFDTLSAFAEPSTGGVGAEISRAIWNFMERMEVINVRAPTVTGAIPIKGLEMELEEVEAVHKMYPATIPFLRLLARLIHTPKRLPINERGEDVAISSIPDMLGQGYRLPGLGPFISFVVDNVFANISTREFVRSQDRWIMNDLCLCFVERCIASYNLEALVTLAQRGQLNAEVIAGYVTHPGFNILKRLLSSTPLQNAILSYIIDGLDGFEKGLAKEPRFHSTVVRVLRIVHRVLSIQDIFVDVLIPLLSEFDASPLVGVVPSRSYFTSLDSALAFGGNLGPTLAAYVAFPTFPELNLLSIKILDILSQSPTFPGLAILIERSADSDRIIHGYCRLLLAESLDDPAKAEAEAEDNTGAGAPNAVDDLDLSQASRLAILDLFIHSTQPNSSHAELAHFLLFGASDARQIEAPNALGGRPTCIHAIIDLLNHGVPRLTSDLTADDSEVEEDPLFIVLPELAERCCRVVHQLCVRPQTSQFTTRYLRTREDFFARQLARLPFQASTNLSAPCIEIVYSDGSRVVSTVPSFTAFLRYRSHILDLVALDIHTLSTKGQWKNISALLQLLFRPDDENEEDADLLQFQPLRGMGQSLLRIIELAASLHFDWSDSLTVAPVDMQLMANLNLQSCIKESETGGTIVDRAAVLSLLASARKALHIQGRITSSADVEQLQLETKYILESCAVENHRREIMHAVVTGFEAWRRLLDITLVKCFARLPLVGRENMLFDLLQVTTSIIQSPDIQEPTAALLAEAVVSVVCKLREDRQHRSLLQIADGISTTQVLSADRLHALLRSLANCVIEGTHGELVRGNLFAAIVDCLHLVNSVTEDATSSPTLGSNTTAALSSLGSVDLSSKQRNAPSIQVSTFGVLKDIIDRLVSLAARDAIDGSEVWKTIAFTLLDGLIKLANVNSRSYALNALMRHGILSNFVRGLQQDDLKLQAVLKPDPDDLNPLYVYEAKMSMFSQIAQTRSGAERLVEVGLVPALARLDCLDARPESDHSFVEYDSLLPSAIIRYHQVLMPALQVASCTLAALGGDHATVSNQLLEFLTSHRDTIVILLKSESGLSSLSLLDELRHLISLCTEIFPKIPKDDLQSSVSGFGAIHASILSLAARTLVQEAFAITPHTESEIVDAQTRMQGAGGTVFDATVRDKVQAFHGALVLYLGTASDFTESDMSLVLIPMITSSQRDDYTTPVLAAAPTVGDVMESLDIQVGQLAGILKKITDLSAELASKGHIRADDVHELVTVPDSLLLDDFDVNQKRALIYHELGRIRARSLSRAQNIMSTLEMLVLLLWRHVSVYCSDSGADSILGLRSSLGRSSRALSLNEPSHSALRSDAATRMRPILSKMAALDIDPDLLGDEWRSNMAYLNILSKRIRDAIGLKQELYSRSSSLDSL